MSRVIVSDLVKQYGGFTALHDISLAIESGEFMFMVGPSGCGKSTLLRTIAGLEEASDGQITIDGDDVTWAEPGARGISMVFQNYALYPHMTVAQNMGYGLRLAKRSKCETAVAVARAADILKLGDHLDKLPGALSGRQRQRVAIGRAITRSPKVFLFDEPVSNLDAALRTQMRVEIALLHRQLGATMIYVTHDQVEAMTMADRIVAMNAGRIEQVGALLDLYHDPVNRFVAGVLGSPPMNFIAATVICQSGGIAQVSAPGFSTLSLAVRRDVTQGASLVLGIRPEHLGTETGAVAVLALIRHAERLGRETILFACVEGLTTLDPEGGAGTLTIQTAKTIRLSSGDSLTLHIDPARMLMFDSDGLRLDQPTLPTHPER